MSVPGPCARSISLHYYYYYYLEQGDERSNDLITNEGWPRFFLELDNVDVKLCSSL